MLRSSIVPVTLMILFLAPLPTWAHDTFRIIGTVTTWKNSELEVTSKDGSSLSVTVSKTTPVMRDKKKVGMKALKVGLSVVVDVMGDSYEGFVADEVTIVPRID